jgi:histidine triad (HIT) family protein
MPSVFTMIIEGDLPGRFVWKDDRCAAFLSINPLRTGHVLVVPRTEIDHWIDADPELLAHLTGVARTIGRALAEAYRPARVGMMIAGLEVPHLHIHVVPIDGVHDLDFANADPEPDPAGLDEAAETIRRTLTGMGHGDSTSR